MKWSRAYKDRLPDSAFLVVSPGGNKDASGRTVPRTLRHLPVRDAKGNVSVRHVRNALARIARTDISAAQKKIARAKAERLLGRSDPPKRKLRWDAWPKEGPAYEKSVRERKRREAASNAKFSRKASSKKTAPRSAKDAKRILELEKALKRCRKGKR